MVSAFPDVSSRLDYVIKTCEYPSAAEFARGIGAKNAQNLTSWRLRNSLGKADVAIAEATGADLMWLRTGKGEPFPNGPIRYTGGGANLSAESVARIAVLERAVDDLVQLFVISLSRFSATTPDAGRAVAADLRAYLARPGTPSEVLPEVMKRLEATLAQPAHGARQKKPEPRR